MNEDWCDEEVRKILNSCGYIPCCCECHKQPTILDPIDSYIVFLKDPDSCKLFGINSIDDIEKYVMRMFLKESWPKYLRDRHDKPI